MVLRYYDVYTCIFQEWRLLYILSKLKRALNHASGAYFSIEALRPFKEPSGISTDGRAQTKIHKKT
jgi:hypothetical protein